MRESTERAATTATTAETCLPRARRRKDQLARRETDTTAATAAKAVSDSFSDPEFRLAVEVPYHGSRQAFLAGVHRWMMFFAVLFGASAAVPFGLEKLFGLLAAAAAAADLAFDFTGRAQIHADIRRRYLEMVAELAADGGVTDFGRRWAIISADEPPVYRIAEDIAHRNACISLNREVPPQIPWTRRIVAHLVKD